MGRYRSRNISKLRWGVDISDRPQRGQFRWSTNHLSKLRQHFREETARDHSCSCVQGNVSYAWVPLSTPPTRATAPNQTSKESKVHIICLTNRSGCWAYGMDRWLDDCWQTSDFLNSTELHLAIMSVASFLQCKL